MKKSLLFLALLGLLLPAFADTVQIGTGTTSTSYFPIRGVSSYSYTQQIYSKAQINTAGNITKLRFLYSSGPIAGSKDWVIYLGHTTKSAFASSSDWIPLANLTQVFDGDVSSYLPDPNNWMEIPLSTPFNYNNTDNLIIAVDENTAGSAVMNWGAFKSANNTGIYCTSGTNIDPASPLSGTRSADINRLQLIFANTSVPSVPIMLEPANGGWVPTNAILKWQSPLGGGDASAYDVYFGTENPPPLVSADQTANSYTPALTENTSYYWKIVAKNELGAAPSSSIHSFRTPIPGLLMESFESATFPPDNWTNPGGWSRNTTYFRYGVASAYKAGTSSTQYVLATPRLHIETDSSLSFWYLSSGINAGHLQVVYSTDKSSWTVLGENIANPANNIWYHYNVDLSSLAGNNYYFGLRTGLQLLNHYVDMVIAPEVAPEAPGVPALSTPADNATGISVAPAFAWTAPTTGGLATGYKIYCDTVNPPTTFMANVNGLSYSPSTALGYSSTYYWKVVPYNASGDGTASAVRSFGTYSANITSDFPIIDGFENGNVHFQPIQGWEQVSGVGYNDWMANNGATDYNRSPRTGDWNAFLRYGNTRWLFKAVQLQQGTQYRAIIYARQDAANPAKASIGISYGAAPSANGMTNAILAPTGVINGAYQRFEGEFSPSATGIYYIGFRGSVSDPSWYLSIDDICIEEMPGIPEFSLSPAALDFGTVRHATPSPSQNIKITNTGGGILHLNAEDFSLIGDNASDYGFSLSGLPANLGAGASLNIPVYVNAISQGQLSASLHIVYESAEYNVPLSAYALPAGTIIIGNSQINQRMPINAGWQYSASQNIYLQSDISVPGKRIEKLAYFWNGAGAAVNSNQWQIYMGHTDKNTFSSTSDWFLPSQLTQVYAGSPILPATAGWIELKLDTPFEYNNSQNLVIAIHERKPGRDSDGYFFFNSNSPGQNRSLRFNSDTNNPEPGTLPAGILVAAYPNIRLRFGDIPTEPVFSVSPNSWDFARTAIRTVKTKQFTIQNYGSGSLQINSISISGEYFSLQSNPAPLSLATSEAVNITVKYLPAAVGTHPGSLNISYGSLSATLPLTGECYDPTIYPPFFEGFEATNTDNQPVAGNWEQIDGPLFTGKYWLANSHFQNYGRQPRTGAWNATLEYNGQSTLLRPIRLEAGRVYTLEFYARQDTNWEDNAWVKASLGTAATLEALTQVIIAQTGLHSGAYQKMQGDFSVETTGIYHIGIQGWLNGVASYISIDDIRIEPHYDYPEDTPTTVGEGLDAITITISGGAANDVPGGVIPPVNNSAFVEAKGFVLELFGGGPWTVTIQTTVPWGACYRAGVWTAVENTSGTEIVFEIPAAKAGMEVPIVLGDKDPTLPVTLSSFSAVLTADMQVKIAWVSQSETDHAGYNLLRGEADNLDTAIRINQALINHGEMNGTQVSYQYTDSQVYPSSTYYYWLESQSLNGDINYYGPLKVQILAQDNEPESPEITLETKLFAAFPNPFNPNTTLRYSMKEAGEAMIQVYNVKGQLVKSYHNRHDAPGYYQVGWDGRDDKGKPLSTGVYFYRMTSGNYCATKKMVLSK